MSDTPVEPEILQEGEKEEQGKRSPLYEISRKVLLAGIGAASLAQEELENFVNKLVERGQMAEKDARRLIREVMERREKLEQERREQRAQRARNQVATRAEIEELTRRVAELSRQLEELRKTLSGGSGA
jgi:polyhydroxyalkanoate synthesis regulator phasin